MSTINSIKFALLSRYCMKYLISESATDTFIPMILVGVEKERRTLIGMC